MNYEDELLISLGSSTKSTQNKLNNRKLKDKFYNDIYEYYYRGGFLSIILSYVTEILSSLFGLIFIIFIFILLDWDEILLCGKENDIENCGEIYNYIKPKVPNFFCIMILFFGIIFILYKIFTFCFNFKNILNIHNFYKKTLIISSKDMQTMSWSDVINILSVYEQNIDVFSNTTIYDITSHILRKENYLIALINNNIINISPYLYTKQLELNIQYIIFNNLDNIHNDNFETSLRYKLIFYGILNLFLSVFVFVFLLLYFFVCNIDDFCSKKNILTDRQYSLYYKRKIRDYNELKHFFEERLNKSVKPALEYIKQFPSPIMEIVGKFIGLISGCFVGFFLILSILDESILLYVRFYDRSLIFYAGVFGIISAIARGMIKSPENRVYDPITTMNDLQKYIQYIPTNWVNKFNTYYVRDSFLKMFDNVIKLFLYDLLSVITTPIILIFVLPKQVSNIVHFIRTNTIDIRNVGNICKFAEFNFNSKNEKMERSITTFKDNHE